MTLATQQKYPLPYFEDSSELFAPIADKPWAVFLDSGFPESGYGRYDIIASDPDVTLVTTGHTTQISKQGQISYSEEDPFLLVKQHLNVGIPSIDGIPFNGGSIGYFSYDLARRLEKLPEISKDEENLPEMVIGIYSWAVIIDHQQQESWLIANKEENHEYLIEQFSSITTKDNKDPFLVLEQPKSNMDKKSYQAAFKKIKAYLLEGDSYQVNLSQRFCSPCSGNPWQAYQALRKINSAPFSAYLNLPHLQILSSSPERFLKVTNGDVETKPIKGTRPRLNKQVADQQQISALSSSKKDRAENLMIVDLLRSDISKNCKEGSVKVPKLFEVESFATVHHLVSTVRGVLAEGQHALDLLRNCFPGGSITGAPKIRSMEIIEELEPNHRGIYCGSIAYIGFDGNMDSSIAIRTLVHSKNTIRFWAGGGIVNDSVMEEEYQESFDKAAALLQLLEQFRVK
ncbi:MAG: aminodeoxychorismate synthase component I [Methylococcales symbiont of Iophon sp. n. MRB-2018]|nr:MAG: aminodeoxychorismate synthase component I [Methylococcales symbiont of Iophon sp. n. MRB-2018]KAF3979635.1 MAG: aminodeoxychorismate synthase component I [Methylococcales symbiont of Iophon sp. n. MRB-2018]